MKVVKKNFSHDIYINNNRGIRYKYVTNNIETQTRRCLAAAMLITQSTVKAIDYKLKTLIYTRFDAQASALTPIVAPIVIAVAVVVAVTRVCCLLTRSSLPTELQRLTR